LKEKKMSKAQAIACIAGGVLGLLICLAAYYWNKENKE
jgi:hypothetical protein